MLFCFVFCVFSFQIKTVHLPSFFSRKRQNGSWNISGFSIQSGANPNSLLTLNTKGSIVLRVMCSVVLRYESCYSVYVMLCVILCVMLRVILCYIMCYVMCYIMCYVMCYVVCYVMLCVMCVCVY